MDNLKKNDFQDPYIDQSSGCLRNLLGIKDSEVLSKIETAFVLNRCYELEYASFNKVVDKTFDFQHLKDIHKHLFQDVYEWAGQARHVDISKGDTWFSPCSRIEKGAHSIFSGLKEQNYLKGLDANDFSKEAGYYLGEINHIHPFREGNGRTQREFINQLAHHNGYHIEWKNISQKQMIEASIEADKGHINPLATLIHENLTDRDIALFIKYNIEQGEFYRVFSPETGKKYDGQVIGLTERYVLQRSINSSSHVVSHDRHSLSRTPRMNEIVEISYPHGDIGLVGGPQEYEPDDLKSRYLKHEWER